MNSQPCGSETYYDSYMHQNKLLYAVRQKKLPDELIALIDLKQNFSFK